MTRRHRDADDHDREPSHLLFEPRAALATPIFCADLPKQPIEV
jgi:hypothetical protein